VNVPVPVYGDVPPEPVTVTVVVPEQGADPAVAEAVTMVGAVTVIVVVAEQLL
jgi:hypothetical protein